MNFQFDKEKYLTHKGRENLTPAKLNGTHPLFIFLLDENQNVLYFDWNMTSKVRLLTKEEATADIQKYNPKWVVENNLSKDVIEQTKYLMTGYYDLIKDQWNMFDCKEVGDFLADSMFDIMVESKVKSSEIFYNDKELYMQNLKVQASYTPAYLFNKDLEDNIDIEEFLNLLINWYQNCKEEVQENTEGKHVIVPVSLVMEYLNSNNVPEKNKEKGESNAFALFRLMLAYDVLEMTVYDKKEKQFLDFNKPSVMSEEELVKRMADFIEVPVFNERFKHLIK